MLASHRHGPAAPTPLPDFGAPDDAEAFCRFVGEARARLARGQAVLAHCNAGLGRTAIFLASLLRECGYPGDPTEKLNPSRTSSHVMIAPPAPSLMI
jgi:Protein-tyrosine phosphatase